MTVKEYAQKNDISEETVRRYIRDGSLKAVKQGRSYQILENNTTYDFDTTKHDTHTTEDNTTKDNKVLQQYVSEQEEQIRELEAKINNYESVLKEKDSLISHLEHDVEHLQSSLTESQMERREAKERSDTIIIHLTKQLEEKTMMLEDLRSRSIWRRVKTALGFARS